MNTKQLNLSFWDDELSRAKTNKKEFLTKMSKIIPWGRWEKLIKPCYYKGEHGNKPYDLDLMLHLCVLQNLYNLSDMQTAAEVIDSRAFSEFCSIESSNQVPNGDTIGRFRNLLEENNLYERFFIEVTEILSEQGLLVNRGTIVDSTIISAPSSTKNAKKERDPEAHQTKKGNNYFFGYKGHIGVDADTGLVHTVDVTAANVNDVTVASKLLTGEEEVVYGDSGYLGAEKREDAIKKNKDGKIINYRINRRYGQAHKGTARSIAQKKRREREKSQIRSKVEHVFHIIKNIFSYRKTRYRGLHKQSEKLNMLFALADLYLADRKGMLA